MVHRAANASSMTTVLEKVYLMCGYGGPGAPGGAPQVYAKLGRSQRKKVNMPSDWQHSWVSGSIMPPGIPRALLLAKRRKPA